MQKSRLTEIISSIAPRLSGARILHFSHSELPFLEAYHREQLWSTAARSQVFLLSPLWAHQLTVEAAVADDGDVLFTDVAGKIPFLMQLGPGAVNRWMKVCVF